MPKWLSFCRGITSDSCTVYHRWYVVYRSITTAGAGVSLTTFQSLRPRVGLAPCSSSKWMSKINQSSQPYFPQSTSTAKPKWKQSPYALFHANWPGSFGMFLEAAWKWLFDNFWANVRRKWSCQLDRTSRRFRQSVCKNCWENTVWS